MDWISRARAVLVAAAIVTLAGCASNFLTVASAPPAHYAILGKATGSACGSLGILSTDANFISIGLNSRVDRAYERALASVPGATGLVNVTLQENWSWWVIGTARCVTIRGEAFK
jgi:hypothetical protein